MTCDVAIVILTYNEQENIAQALDSVIGWARQVFVFDSYSTDRTLEIARARGCPVVQHRFEDFGRQRNAALDLLPIEAEWVFFLDADEWLPDTFKREVERTVAARPLENGFQCRRRLMWMGTWVRRGYHNTRLLRMFRRGRARCEERTVNECMIVDGPVGLLQSDFMHEDRNGLGRWVDKHNGYAAREAFELARTGPQESLPGRLFGTQAERRRWIRHHAWDRLPLVARPFLYFGWRYVARGGFLDGRKALGYHILQALWFPVLIDLKYLELTKQQDPLSSFGSRHANELKALFDSKAASWSRKYNADGPLSSRLEAFAGAISRVQPPAEVLDFGCGTGDLATRLAASGYSVTACDVSTTMLAEAQKATSRVDWRLIEDPGAPLPFANGQFDAIVASSVLEYAHDLDATMQELSRVLKPGGVLLASVPAVRHPTRQLEHIVTRLLGATGFASLVRMSRSTRSFESYLRLSKNRLSSRAWDAIARDHGLRPVSHGIGAPSPTLDLLCFQRAAP